MSQLSLFPDTAPVVEAAPDTLAYGGFSHGNQCPETARMALEERYRHLLVETDEFSRRTVSFQANKTETLHGWMQYREGFSANLVETLIRKFQLTNASRILEPFAGSCTTLLVGMLSGISATGIELLPHCQLAWEAKRRVYNYDLDELEMIYALVSTTAPPAAGIPFPHVSITESAFPAQNEQDLMVYVEWGPHIGLSANAELLWRFVLLSILEEISYTRKDGQFLRWDARASKMRERNDQRAARGQSLVQGIDKGRIPTVKEAFLNRLRRIISDVRELQRTPIASSDQLLINGNTLYTLPFLEDNQFDAVITSPPYVNRYDYTRTYALELAYLGIGTDIFGLRQGLLSCTVESRTKVDALDAFYNSLGIGQRYTLVSSVIEDNAALAEVAQALHERNQRGEINNQGVLTMVTQYFSELAFVYAETFRVCRSGAHVAFVNDNVRYAGEIIPVDMICTNLAETLGFIPESIFVLPQRKGNSSQQMQRFGRVALRKSITVWRKP